MTTCDICNQPVILLKTTNGSTVLVDLDGVKPTDRFFNKHQHTPHEQSCSPTRSCISVAFNATNLQPAKKPHPLESKYHSPRMKPLLAARTRGYLAGFQGFTPDQNDGQSDDAQAFWDQGYRLGLFDRSR